jgi:hypothetical protein
VYPPSPGLFFFIMPVPAASSLLSISRPEIKFALIEPSVSVDMGMITKIGDKSQQLDDFRQIVREAVELRRNSSEA